MQVRTRLVVGLFALGLACSSPTNGGEPDPSVSLGANPTTIDAGQSSTLTWSSTATTGCTASGGWSGAKLTSGSQSVTPANTTTYTLTCTGAGGTATASTTVTVNPVGGLSLTFTANPSFIISGQSSLLEWVTLGATGCTASDGWTGPQPVSGSMLVSPAATTTYTLTCTNGTGGSTAQSVTVVVSAPPGGPYVYPLTVGPTSRYLVDQNGKPFFMAGDAAWSLIAELGSPETETYLSNRQQLGFTLVMVNLIEHAFATNPPANAAGDLPFTGAVFTTPNEAYFAHADAVIQSAAQKGLVVMLAPLYLGAGCGSEGWCAEVQAASTQAMTQWGQYVGNRYKTYDNILWMIGGDADPSPVQAKVQAMVDGILSQDTRHLFTAHNAPDQMAIDPWGRPAWLTVNNIYTYSNTQYNELLATYAVSPTMPYFFLETKYENEWSPSPTAQQLRAQSYWAVLSGAFGHVFGNCPIWHFGSSGGYCSETDWLAELNGPGSTNIQHWQALFTSRHWHTLVPATALLTAGAGSGTDRAAAARASDGSSIIAYLPSSRGVTLNASQLSSGALTVWWVDPANGQVTQDAGSYSTAAPLSLTPPAGTHDWVIVVDAAGAGFPPPGS